MFAINRMISDLKPNLTDVCTSELLNKADKFLTQLNSLFESLLFLLRSCTSINKSETKI